MEYLLKIYYIKVLWESIFFLREETREETRDFSARRLTFPVETLRVFWALDKQVAEFIQKHGVIVTQHVVIAPP